MSMLCAFVKKMERKNKLFLPSDADIVVKYKTIA